jgi:hypothetical protein
MNDYSVKAGSISVLEEIIELDRVVFGLSRTPEEVKKLELRRDVHITIATVDGGRVVGYGIGGASRFCPNIEGKE